MSFRSRFADTMMALFRWWAPLLGPKPWQIRVEQVRVAIPDLPARLEGYTIGVLSDLHIGPLVRPDLIRRAADLLAKREPDLVVMAGDLLSKSEYAGQVDQVLAPVAGCPGVRGNWDWHRRPALRKQRAVRFLVNRGYEPAPGLWLAGIDDAQLGEPDLRRALDGAPPGAVRILLAHEPEFADQVQAEHQIALQISGHSHGGQVRLPLIGPLLLPPLGRKYHTGLHRAPHCQVYTTRGVGVVHIPIRLFCPPEVTLITLTRA